MRMEVECLLWSTAGKTDWDIGVQLGVSERYVSDLFEIILRKFGVPTRTQAVVQAILSGQIEP